MSYNTNNQSNVLAVMRSKIPLSASGIPKNMTLSEFAEYWLKYLTPDLKVATRYSYSRIINLVQFILRNLLWR